MIADVRPVESGDDQTVGRDAELRQDVGPGPRVRSRGERQPRHVGVIVEQRVQLPIVGPEIVPPFADAMCFVDRDQREVDAADQPAEALAGGAFGRDIKQVEFAGA